MAIIDERFAQRFWPHDDPVGKQLWFDPKKPFIIAGVVGVVRHYGLDTENKIVVYFPQKQDGNNGMYLAVKTAADPARTGGGRDPRNPRRGSGRGGL